MWDNTEMGSMGLGKRRKHSSNENPVYETQRDVLRETNR